MAVPSMQPLSVTVWGAVNLLTLSASPPPPPQALDVVRCLLYESLRDRFEGDTLETRTLVVSFSPIELSEAVREPRQV